MNPLNGNPFHRDSVRYYSDRPQYASEAEAYETAIDNELNKIDELNMAIADQAIATGVIRKMFASFKARWKDRSAIRAGRASERIRPIAPDVEELQESNKSPKLTAAAELPSEDEILTSGETFCVDNYLPAASAEDLDDNPIRDS